MYQESHEVWHSIDRFEILETKNHLDKSIKGVVPLVFVERNNIFFKSRQQTLVAPNTCAPHITTKFK